MKWALTSRWAGVRSAGQQLAEPELDAYLYSLAQPGGLAPGVHYYRNLFGWVGLGVPRLGALGLGALGLGVMDWVLLVECS